MKLRVLERLGVALLTALLLAAPVLSGRGFAQQAEPSATPSPSPQPPSPTPAAPAPATQQEAPASGAPPAAPATPQTPESPQPAKPPGDSSMGQTIDLAARPAAYMEGKTTWDEGFSAITGSFAIISSELTKAGLKSAGRPITVFLETDDTGFRYRAMVPLDNAPAGKTSLPDAVKIGQTPAGKAMRFEHRGSYEDIDATYEAITAYLDERGIEAGNSFVEEYLNEVKDPSDPNLQVDIFVLLK
jgi:effector-binding domain-containing protein